MQIDSNVEIIRSNIDDLRPIVPVDYFMRIYVNITLTTPFISVRKSGWRLSPRSLKLSLAWDDWEKEIDND